MQPGGGARLGDSRNSPAFGTASFGGAWDDNAITYSGTAAAMTISVPSTTLYNGSWQVTYNASSAVVSGPAGATFYYTLYYDDPGQVGGSQTLHAVANRLVASNSDSRVVVGYRIPVTFPSSGSGSGSGTTPCVEQDSWLRVQRRGVPQFMRAKDLVPVQVGDMIRAIDPATGRQWWQQMTGAELATNEGVRVTCADGTALECSANAILGAADGSRVRADDSTGTSLRTSTGSSTASTESIGTITVVRISSGGVFFLAGTTQDRMLAHHNMKPPSIT